MRLSTASEIISFAKRLEMDSAEFYRILAENYTDDGAFWLSFADENGKNVMQIERAYYGVISDAIEGCFAFNIDPDQYTFDAKLTERPSYNRALIQARGAEEKIIKFYLDAAQQSRSLMADVPRAFEMVARKRAKRLAKLDSLISDKGARYV
jgi:hypothetical protein